MVDGDDALDLGLIVISTLHGEGKINDDEKDKLKNMLFSEDSTLLALLSQCSGNEDDPFL